MARTLKTEEIDDIPTPISEFNDAIAAGEAPDSYLMRVLGQLGEQADQATVRLYRIDNASKRGEEEYLRKYPVQEFDIDVVQDQWGGGRFRVRVYNPNGKLISCPIIKLFGPPKVPKDTGQNGHDVLPAPTITAADIAAAVAAVMPRAPSREETLRELQVYAEIFRPAAAPAAQPANLFEIFFKGLEFGKEIIASSTPDPSGNRVFEKMIDSFGPAIMQAVAAAQAAPAVVKQTAPAVARIPLDPAANAAPAPAAPAEPSEDEVLKMLQIKMGVSMLVEQAKRSGDLTLYADWVLDNVPEDQVRELLQAPDWFDRLSAINPEVRTNRVWFESLRAEVEKALADGPVDESAETLPNDDDLESESST